MKITQTTQIVKMQDVRDQQWIKVYTVELLAITETVGRV